MVKAPSWLPKRGYFGLVLLKHYLKLSDEKLLERFNTERVAAQNPVHLHLFLQSHFTKCPITVYKFPRPLVR